MSDPQSIVVVGNRSGQVLLVSGYGWYRPLPPQLRVRPDGKRLVFLDPLRGEVGAVPVDCAGALMSASEVFLGGLGESTLRTDARVVLSWDIGGEASA